MSPLVGHYKWQRQTCYRLLEESAEDRIGEGVEEFFLARGPSSSAVVRGLVIHDIKEVEGVRQQEEQEDHRAHET